MTTLTATTIDGIEYGTIVHEGHEYTAMGSHVTPEDAVGYAKIDEVDHWQPTSITSWEGKHLGYARITASWSTPQSYWSRRMYQIRACINGVWYTGRTAGNGMLWRGKRCAQQ